MDRDQLNQLLALGANIGVIIGIVFLAIELRQNNEYLAEESRYSQVQNRIEFNRDLAMNPELAAMYYQTEDGNEVKRRQSLAVKRRVLLQWQWEYGGAFAGR